jgi:hypothetical protein
MEIEGEMFHAAGKRKPNLTKKAQQQSKIIQRES